MVIIRNLNNLTRTALLLALTVCIQSIRLPQVATGPLVNMMLIFTVLAAGVSGAVAVGALTPWLAILFGIVPGQMLPVLPFLMAGNILYCLVFGALKRNVLLGLAAGSLAKFVVIGGGAQLLLNLPTPLGQMLIMPQLVNALWGGAVGIALGVYVFRERHRSIGNELIELRNFTASREDTKG